MDSICHRMHRFDKRLHAHKLSIYRIFPANLSEMMPLELISESVKLRFARASCKHS